MPELLPAYLIHGDDHGRIAERRAKLREIGEAAGGAHGVEILEGVAPGDVAAALSAMTFAIGRRVILVDGTEDWKDGDVKDALSPALAAMPPDTTVAFFAREDGRRKAPAALAKSVEKAGGKVEAEQTLKAKELPAWVASEAAKLGISVDAPAAKLLVDQVGERQQRLLRELEKLALEHGQGATVGVDEVESAAAVSAEHQVWGLVDAMVARNRARAFGEYLELREQGEDAARLVPLLARRFREVLGIARRLEAGESPAQIKESMRGNPYVLGRRIDEARKADPDKLAQALEAMARLELQTRGMSDLETDTLAVRAIARVTTRA